MYVVKMVAKCGSKDEYMKHLKECAADAMVTPSSKFKRKTHSNERTHYNERTHSNQAENTF
jgi:hypothetical protein